MPAKYVCETFFLQHSESLAQSVNEIGRRRKRKKTCLVWAQHVPPVPIGSVGTRALAGRQTLLRNRIKTQTRRKHQTLLRTRDGDVHFPFVVAIIDRSQG